MAIKYRAYKKTSANQFLERLDGTDGADWGVTEAAALAEISASYGIDAGDLEAVTGASDPRTGTLILPTPLAWGVNERNTRNMHLANSDWTQAADSPLSSDKKTEWATYRQALRDLPTNETDAHHLTWPTAPS